MKSTNPLRQKLINLLYIVLICMIVLNLPLDFIEAFTDLNRSLENANRKLDQRSHKSLDIVAQYAQRDSFHFKKYYDRIRDVKAISDSAVEYLDSIKTLLIFQGGGWDTSVNHLKSATEPNIPMRYMIRAGIGKETHEMLIHTKRELMKYLNANEQTSLDTVLITRDHLKKVSGKSSEWDDYYFHNVPLGAAVALLTKFQNDVRLAETIVISKYEEEAQRGITFIVADNNQELSDERRFDFDTVMLQRAEHNPDVYNLGEEASINVSVPNASEDALKNAVIYTYDSKGAILDSFLFKEGVGEISIPTEQIGEFKIKGVVKFRYMDEGPGDVKETPESLLKKEKDKDNDSKDTKKEKKEEE